MERDGVEWSELSVRHRVIKREREAEGEAEGDRRDSSWMMGWYGLKVFGLSCMI